MGAEMVASDRGRPTRQRACPEMPPGLGRATFAHSVPHGRKQGTKSRPPERRCGVMVEDGPGPEAPAHLGPLES